ncbi:hypothetical protein Hanom_Chr07g00620961 [Helianthus anomalus]
MIVVASAFAGHQEVVQDRDDKFLTCAVEEAYKGVENGEGGLFGVSHPNRWRKHQDETKCV